MSGLGLSFSPGCCRLPPSGGMSLGRGVGGGPCLAACVRRPYCWTYPPYPTPPTPVGLAGCLAGGTGPVVPFLHYITPPPPASLNNIVPGHREAWPHNATTVCHFFFIHSPLLSSSTCRGRADTGNHLGMEIAGGSCSSQYWSSLVN